MEASSITSRSHSSGFSSSRLKPKALRVELEQAVDGLGLHAGRLGHALGCPSGGGAEQKLRTLGRQDAQDRVHDGGLADARAAGDDQHLGAQRQTDGLHLAGGEREPGAALRSMAVPYPRRSPARACLPDKSRRSRSAIALLGVIEPAEKDTRRVAHAVGRDRSLGQLQIDRRPDQRLRHLQKLLGKRHQLLTGNPQ